MKSAIAATSTLLLLTGAAYAQGPTPAASPTPAAATAPEPAPTVPLSLEGLKPGATYLAWSTGTDSVAEVSASSKGVRVAASAKELYLLDRKTGQVATLQLATRNGEKLNAAKLTFASLAPISVAVTVLSSSNKKPVTGATVSINDAGGNQQKGSVDAQGVAKFENVKPGDATVQLQAGKAEASFQRILLPRPPGTPIALSESLATIDTPATEASPGVAVMTGSGNTPQVVIVDRGKEPGEQSNSALPGWIGLIVLGVGGFFGWRWLKTRGMTVKDALEKAGVNLPEESASGVNPNLRPPSPASTPLPPLPSLGDLPSAGPASTAGVAVSGGTVPVPAPPLPAPTGQPKLTGVRGPLAGQTYPLTDVLTVGREPDNTIALPGDSTASRKHAVIMPSPAGGWEIADSGSSNGTFVNGMKIAAPTPLAHGDEIAIGTARLRFEA
ncbi:MAG: FHA domain-containing protein [Armatimonas sp.]